MFTQRGFEVGINEDESQSEGQGEVGALDNGNYAVVFWQQGAEGNPQIQVRIVDNNGNPFLSLDPIGHDILVSDSAGSGSGGNNNNYIDQPVIAPVAGGGFIVAWTERVFHETSDGFTYSTLEVRAQTYNSAGLPVGELIQIEGATDPHISVSHAGHVLAYSTYIEGDNSAPDSNPSDDVQAIMALTIGTNGSQLGTTEISRAHPDSTGTGAAGVFDVVATAAVGTGHVIAWQMQENFTFDPDLGYGTFDIVNYVQAFSGFGPVSQPLVVPFTVSDIAATGDGNFVVVGLVNNPDTNWLDVVAVMVNGTSGQIIGDPFVVNTHTDGDQYAPSVTTLGGDGGFVIVWHDDWNGAVGAQEFDNLGQPVGPEIPVSLDVADDFAFDYSSPDVAADPYGGIMITWTGWDADGYGVRAQVLSQAPIVQFFGDAGEVVDFNNLTAEQQQLLDDAVNGGQVDSVYDAGDGNDNVILPDIAEIEVTPNYVWDYDRTFFGSTGNDTITGGDGNDIIDGEDGDDVIRGGDGDDTLRGGHGNDQLFGGNGNDLLSESQGDYGPFGNDVYDGGAGSDRVSYFINLFAGTVTVDLTLTGAQVTGQGTDTLIGIEHITSTYGDDTLIGNNDANWFWTFSGFDRLTGNGGNDYFTVGAGDKIADGGTGIDTIEIADFAYDPIYTSEGITVSLALQGQAQAVGTGTWTLTGFENLGGFNGDDELTGDGNANVLAGQLGNDTLRGGGGNDRLFGDGTWIFNDAGVQELIENDSVDGPGGNDFLDGGAGDDYLFGAGGDDFLIGGDGNDQLIGGDGVDMASYAGAFAGVRINLGSSNAQNTIGSGLDTLVGVENLIGSAFDDILTGNDGANILQGGRGNDYLYGLGGDDNLAGGIGIDRMLGGAGNDTYTVTDATDYVYENAGEGVDIVLSSVTHVLRANVENLTLTGSAGTYATGNDLDNVITGNGAANRLFGMDGNDTIYAGGGNDRIEGGAGVDVLYGGSGNDIYAVNDLDDTIVENAGEGTDVVYASVAYAMADNVERLYLTGTGALDGTGNSGANVINGNIGNNSIAGLGGDDILYGFAGNDTLNGGAGVDRLIGGEGDDTYLVSDSTDYVYEAAGQGYDTVLSSVTHALRVNIEALVLTGSGNSNGTGNDIANTITGNGGANVLRGAGGNDTLDGGAGADILSGDDGNDMLRGGSGQDRAYGGAGADMFVFANGDFGGATAATADRIHDFSQAEGDTISLSGVDANTLAGGDQAFGFIGTAAFHGQAGELRYEQINGTTYIQGDTDGDGQADFCIMLDGTHAMTSSDFGL